jgi:hypothetical protein
MRSGRPSSSRCCSSTRPWRSSARSPGHRWCLAWPPPTLQSLDSSVAMLSATVQRTSLQHQEQQQEQDQLSSFVEV